MDAYHHPPVHVRLENEELLAQFNIFTQENIVTRSGRRLFPHYQVLIDNLDPSSIYDIYVDFVERGRYAWIHDEWVKTRGASSDNTSWSCERVQQHQAYLHKDSPNSGRFWTANPVSFARMKLTNRTQDLTPGQRIPFGEEIVLKPMHKYEPRIHIVQRQPLDQPNLLIHSQTLPIASFIAVTAYKNIEITTLKIRHNPFAQAFINVVHNQQQHPQASSAFFVGG